MIGLSASSRCANEIDLLAEHRIIRRVIHAERPALHDQQIRRQRIGGELIHARIDVRNFKAVAAQHRVPSAQILQTQGDEYKVRA